MKQAVILLRIQMVAFAKRHQAAVLVFVVIIGLTASVELAMGRLPLGPDGTFGWWDGNIWGSENSQRVADVYSFSHIIHGILFYAILWLIAREIPLWHRFLIAVSIEAVWEILENSPLIINRYREATIALGYSGDSILNSCSDILMMSLGFLFAWGTPAVASIALVLVLEVGCLFWVRDNLTLNIIMLIHPIHAIRVWQAAGRPLP
jgi:Protein of unknown function (DUF2585)